MLLYTMLYIVLAYLILFAALTNSVCLNNASFFFLFKYFLCQGYELSEEIALKNNHYYYYYYYYSQLCFYALYDTYDYSSQVYENFHASSIILMLSFFLFLDIMAVMNVVFILM